MKTEDAIDEQMTPTGPGQGHSKGTSWLAGLGAIFVVALVIGDLSSMHALFTLKPAHPRL